MRHSSIKSIVAAAAITISLTAAAPTAFARQAESPREAQVTRARENDRDADRFAVVRRMAARALRKLASLGGITIPIPPSQPTDGN